MDAGDTPYPSILDKPLSQLTEEDISQLTREDCRKYLKEKGMRRPSWNKSQAIQQVISLKALLEDSGAGALRKILNSKSPETPYPAASIKEPSVDANNIASLAVNESVYGLQNDSPKSTPSEPLDCQPEEPDTRSIASRSPGATNGPAGQLTIFYCGKVIVYDGVPPDKAQAIMHLAGSPFQYLPSDPHGGVAARSFPCHLRAQTDKQSIIYPVATMSQTMQTEKISEYPHQHRDRSNIAHDSDVEGQPNRKMSLQRYFEKRKDRGRFKTRKNLGHVSSSLEVYMNHQPRTSTSNGQSTRSSTCSPPWTGVPHASCNSADNQSKITNFPVDLNEDIGEC